MNYNEKYLNYKAKYIKLKLKLEMERNNNELVISGGGNNDKQIYLFKADWCPHCTSIKPIWEELEKENKDKIKFITYDSVKHAKEIVSFNIEGYPTIILKVGYKSFEYVGPHDKLSIKEFIKQYN